MAQVSDHLNEGYKYRINEKSLSLLRSDANDLIKGAAARSLGTIQNIRSVNEIVDIAQNTANPPSPWVLTYLLGALRDLIDKCHDEINNAVHDKIAFRNLYELLLKHTKPQDPLQKRAYATLRINSIKALGSLRTTDPALRDELRNILLNDHPEPDPTVQQEAFIALIWQHIYATDFSKSDLSEITFDLKRFIDNYQKGSTNVFLRQHAFEALKWVSHYSSDKQLRREIRERKIPGIYKPFIKNKIVFLSVDNLHARVPSERNRGLESDEIFDVLIPLSVAGFVVILSERLRETRDTVALKHLSRPVLPIKKGTTENVLSNLSSNLPALLPSRDWVRHKDVGERILLPTAKPVIVIGLQGEQEDIEKAWGNKFDEVVSIDEYLEPSPGTKVNTSQLSIKLDSFSHRFTNGRAGNVPLAVCTFTGNATKQAKIGFGKGLSEGIIITKPLPYEPVIIREWVTNEGRKQNIEVSFEEFDYNEIPEDFRNEHLQDLQPGTIFGVSYKKINGKYHVVVYFSTIKSAEFKELFP